MEPQAARRILLSSGGLGLRHRGPGPSGARAHAGRTDAVPVNLRPGKLTAAHRLSAARPEGPGAEPEAAGRGNALAESQLAGVRDGHVARRAAAARCSEPAAAARVPAASQGGRSTRPPGGRVASEVRPLPCRLPRRLPSLCFRFLLPFRSSIFSRNRRVRSPFRSRNDSSKVNGSKWSFLLVVPGRLCRSESPGCFQPDARLGLSWDHKPAI
ncbi:uncharacterized protein LOC116568278 [Mustela erminea]|uniref:uncharacterized protein LOC116568278 n=1 Tax=Mustela erminea TaxID=36723 RepID=UPI0013875CE8|nr:uncharacterized protein LOC116568278 [Mustela erminea]